MHAGSGLHTGTELLRQLLEAVSAAGPSRPGSADPELGEVVVPRRVQPVAQDVRAQDGSSVGHRAGLHGQHGKEGSQSKSQSSSSRLSSRGPSPRCVRGRMLGVAMAVKPCFCFPFDACLRGQSSSSETNIKS